MNIVGLAGFMLGILMAPAIFEKLVSIGTIDAGIIGVMYGTVVGMFLLLGIKGEQER